MSSSPSAMMARTPAPPRFSTASRGPTSSADRAELIRVNVGEQPPDDEDVRAHEPQKMVSMLSRASPSSTYAWLVPLPPPTRPRPIRQPPSRRSPSAHPARMKRRPATNGANRMSSIERTTRAEPSTPNG